MSSRDTPASSSSDANVSRRRWLRNLATWASFPTAVRRRAQSFAAVTGCDLPVQK